MKLYTEEQLREILMSIDTNIYMSDSYIDSKIDSLTPIELPSDEEIVGEAESISKGYKALGLYNEDYYDGFTEGAKWVIEQIKQQVIP